MYMDRKSFLKRSAAVAAVAVITKDVTAYTIVGGIPAKFMKHITYNK